jgi:beta-1,6-N-acetylglucosaminyltransferase 4
MILKEKFFKLILFFIISNIIVIFLIKNNPFQSNENDYNPETKSDGEEEKEEEDLFTKLIQREKYPVDCKLLFEWDKSEMDKSLEILQKLRNKDITNKPIIDLLKTENYIFNESKCDLFKQIRGYNSHRVEESELEMPIAFSILTHDNLEQLERLLRIIYRQHNVYCIHVDSKTDPKDKEAIESITKCFSNVFIATKLEQVYYAHFSRVQADLNCMSDLINPNSNLKFIYYKIIF